MSAPTVPPPRDYVAEAQAILKDETAPFVVTREHLLAVQASVAEVAKTSALMNRALCALMVDAGQPALAFPPGLINFVETHRLDLTLEYVKGAIAIHLIRPGDAPNDASNNVTPFGRSPRVSKLVS